MPGARASSVMRNPSPASASRNARPCVRMKVDLSCGVSVQGGGTCLTRRRLRASPVMAEGPGERKRRPTSVYSSGVCNRTLCGRSLCLLSPNSGRVLLAYGLCRGQSLLMSRVVPCGGHCLSHTACGAKEPYVFLYHVNIASRCHIMTYEMGLYSPVAYSDLRFFEVSVAQCVLSSECHPL